MLACPRFWALSSFQVPGACAVAGILHAWYPGPPATPALGFGNSFLGGSESLDGTAGPAHRATPSLLLRVRPGLQGGSLRADSIHPGGWKMAQMALVGHGQGPWAAFLIRALSVCHCTLAEGAMGRKDWPSTVRDPSVCPGGQQPGCAVSGPWRWWAHRWWWVGQGAVRSLAARLGTPQLSCTSCLLPGLP